MKDLVQTHILMRTWNLFFIYFTGVSHCIMKSILNVKNNIYPDYLVISSYNIYSRIKSQQAK